MKPLNQNVEQLSKEYLIKINNVTFPIMKSDIGQSFTELLIESLDIKWLRVPCENEHTTLQKLCFQNKSSKAIDVEILIHYKVRNEQPIPFVYYSPTSEAMMLCNRMEYCLIGGTSSYGGPLQYQTNEKDIELSVRVNSLRSVFPPFSQESNGCGMVYHLKIDGDESTYLYDWEIKHKNLFELETSHEYLRDLLGEKTFN